MPKWRQIEGELVLVEAVATTERKGPYVQSDIDPYHVVGPEYNKLITSRSHHREYLRKHDLIEAGNERKEFGLPDD